MGWDLGVAASILRDKYLRFVHPNYREAFLEASKSTEATETEKRNRINRELAKEVRLNESLLKLFAEANAEEVANRLQQKHPDFYEKVYRHSEEFRFGPSVLLIERPVINVCAALKKQISNLAIREAPKEVNPQLKRQIEFMLEQYPTMAKALRLSSNEVGTKETIHHLKYRAQWKVSDELFAFGRFLFEKSLLNRPEGIFDLGIEALVSIAETHSAEYRAAQESSSPVKIDSPLKLTEYCYPNYSHMTEKKFIKSLLKD